MPFCFATTGRQVSGVATHNERYMAEHEWLLAKDGGPGLGFGSSWQERRFRAVIGELEFFEFTLEICHVGRVYRYG